ncbi:MAG: FimV/HubP family polar landmark protein, partial [Steroidobacteraceae bacterium]
GNPGPRVPLIAMRALVTALLAAVLLSPSGAAALELGASRLLSSAGEPLNVEIPVLQAEPEQLERLRPELPSRSRSANLAGAIITLEREGPRSPLLRVRSVGPMDGKAVTFLVIADWGRGRTLRTYTVLPEPPVQSPASLSTSKSEGTATPATTEVIRSTPIEEGTPVPRARAEAETVIPAANAAPTPTAGADSNAATRTVRRNETLMSISREWSARTGTTLAQTMLGIYRANPEAFGNGMGDMKVGSTLKLPDAATLRAVSNAEANREVGRQLGIWGQSAPASPAPAAPVAPVSPAPAPKQPAAPAASTPKSPPVATKPAPPAAPAPIAIAPAAAPPAPVAKDPAFKSLEARGAQAERELAALQARLGQVEKIKTAPPVVTAPPVAVAPPAVTTPPVAAAPPPAAAAPAPLTFSEPSPPSATGAKDAAAPAEPTSPATSGAASGAPEAPTNDAAKAPPAASGPKVPSLPAAPPFKPAPTLQERALEIAKHYWWALAGAGGALLLGIAALVMVRRRRAAAAASSEPAQEMTFDLPPIKPSRAEPEDLDDVLMRPAGNAGGASSGGAAAGAAAGLGAAAMAAMEPAASVPETRVAPPPLPNDLEGDPPPIDEAGSMIDLARAYIEMGNFDSAMMELQTALRTGDEAQRAEALRLLDSLPKS